MSEWSDEELGMGRSISRRDFLDGIAVTAGALAVGSVAGAGPAAAAATTGPYPPLKHGLGGQTNAAMAVPHGLRDGTFWESAGEPQDTGEPYDLVVVGGGISGLAAARFYQSEFGRDARILILDALADVGGHAVRNEFRYRGRTLVGYGGSQSMDTPSTFNKPARRLLDDIGIELKRFEKFFDADFTTRHKLGRAIFFDKESWGRDHYVSFSPGKAKQAELLKNAPMSAKAKRDLARLYEAPKDWLPGLSDAEKKDVLAGITYLQYLVEHVKIHPDALKYLQTMPNGYWGYGADAVGALDASGLYPGFDGLKLNWSKPDRRLAPTAQKFFTAEDEYIYHFPEGNAGIARSLVRKLIPQALPGRGMETITTVRMDYGLLDRKGNKVRIRLNAPVVRVKHEGDPDGAKRVQVTYLKDGALQLVRAAHVVLACNHRMIPHLTDEISEEQREALRDQSKLALMYTSVLIRDWTAFKKLKISGVRYPTMYWDSAGLDFPVSIGSYEFPDNPREPAILHLGKAVCEPGLPPREQGMAGRHQLLKTSFREMEHALRDQLARVLAPGGFDPARDIEAITVNRWAHGYAYEYGLPWDTYWPDGDLPSHTARRPWGRIAVANADAGPRAYADSAIDMAYRAVRDLAGKPSPEVSRGVDGVAP